MEQSKKILQRITTFIYKTKIRGDTMKLFTKKDAEEVLRDYNGPSEQYSTFKEVVLNHIGNSSDMFSPGDAYKKTKKWF